MAKPTVLPEWASTLAVDPVTLVANRIEPSLAKKQAGWDFNEKPPRQFDNFLHFNTFKWLEFFDGVIDQDVRSGSNPTFGAMIAATLALSGNLTVDDVIASGNVSGVDGIFSRDVFGIDGIFTGELSSDDLLITKVNGSATAITGAELETLSDGSNADALHNHSETNPIGFSSGMEHTVALTNPSNDEFLISVINPSTGRKLLLTKIKTFLSAESIIKRFVNFNFTKIAAFTNLNFTMDVKIGNILNSAEKVVLVVNDGTSEVGVKEVVATVDVTTPNVFTTIAGSIGIGAVPNGTILEVALSTHVFANSGGFTVRSVIFKNLALTIS